MQSERHVPEYLIAPAGTAGQLAIYDAGIRVASVIDEDRARELVAYAEAGAGVEAYAGMLPGDEEEEEGRDVVRVLRRLPKVNGCRDAAGQPPPNRAATVAIVDVETTGLDPMRDKIIQLSVVLLALDEDDVVIGTLGEGQWFEDPGFDVPPEITKLTNICTRDVRDHKIDDAAVAAMMREVDVIVAHNAAFDRGFWDIRFPELADYCWACSLQDVDWRCRGCPSSALLCIAWARGYDFNAHNAASDTAALASLLATAPEGETYPSVELMKNARQRRHFVYAAGAPFAVKDTLKARGYEWLPTAKMWRTTTTRPDDEAAWLAENAHVSAPEVVPIRFSDRFRRAS